MHLRNFINLFKNFYKLIYTCVDDAINHDGIEHAGYISFLLMLSIFPFIIIFMALVGFFGDQKFGLVLIEMIVDSKWSSFIDALKPRILEISSTPPQSLLTLALISATWTASSIFEAIRTILNRAYRVTNTPPYILRRLFSIVEFFIAIGFCLLFVGFTVILPHLWSFLHQLPFFGDFLIIKLTSPQLAELRYSIMLMLIFILLCYLYSAIANLKTIRMRDTIPGSIFCLVTWALFGQIFQYYLSHFPQVNFIYGSIAGVIIALLYFYFMSIFFIIGAELNYHVLKKNG